MTLHNLPHLPDPEAIEATPNDLKWIAVALLQVADSAHLVGLPEPITTILDALGYRWQSLYVRAMLETDDLDAIWTGHVSDEGI